MLFFLQVDCKADSALASIPWGKAMRKIALYRHFDCDDRLLYVGLSLKPMHRLEIHRDKDWQWFYEITRVEIEWLASVGEAINAEDLAIRTEHPRYPKRAFKDQSLNFSQAEVVVAEGEDGALLFLDDEHRAILRSLSDYGPSGREHGVKLSVISNALGKDQDSIRNRLYRLRAVSLAYEYPTASGGRWSITDVGMEALAA